jgi:Sigma-70, region 4
VRPVPNGTFVVRGPDPARPCEGCSARDDCHEPCSALVALIPPPEIRSWREFGSVALMEGWGAVAAAPSSDDGFADGGPTWPQIAVRYGPRLRAVLSQLPRRQRAALVGVAEQRSRRDTAAALGVSIASVDRAKHAGLAALQSALGPAPAHDRFFTVPMKDDGQEVHAMKKASIRVRSTQEAISGATKPAPRSQPTAVPLAGRGAEGRILSAADAWLRESSLGPSKVAVSRHCAAPGCERLIDDSGAAQTSGVSYCRDHRRLRATRLGRADRFAAAAARDALALRPAPALEEARALATATGAGEAIRATITPALALALLERNKNNRAISEVRVEQYARDMVRGQWHLNNQGIALGADGDLYDGQHRLWAVVYANVAVEMLVVRGLSAEARPTIDQGRARSVGDALRIVDGVANGARVAAYVRALRLLVSKRRLTVSHADVCAATSEYAPTIAWFAEHGPKAQPYNRAAVVGALMYAHRVAPEPVATFLAGYVGGIGLPAGSPMLAFRNYLLERSRSAREDERTVALKTLRCLLAHVRGEAVDRVYAGEEGFEYFLALHAATPNAAA